MKGLTFYLTTALVLLVSANVGAQVEEVWRVHQDRGGSNEFNDEHDLALVVDQDGFVYVTHPVFDATDFDIVTKKINPDGTVAWEVIWDGGFIPVPGEPPGDIPRDIAVSEEVVCVTGQTLYGHKNDYITICYEIDDGDIRWVKKFNKYDEDDEAYAVAVCNGYVYVTGECMNDEILPDDEIVTVQYDVSDGTEYWDRVYSGLADGNDWATCIAVDEDCNVYLAGSTWRQNDLILSRDWITISYAPDGTRRWVTFKDGEGDFEGCADLARDILIPEGCSPCAVYVAGQLCGGLLGGRLNYGIAKYDCETGDELADDVYDGAGGNDAAFALAADASCYIYLTGESWNGSGYNLVTLKYNSTLGQEVAVDRYPFESRGRDVAVDGLGRPWATGWREYDSSGNPSDYLTIVYNAHNPADPSQFGREAEAIWSHPGADEAYAVGADGACAYVTGESGEDDEVVTIKYEYLPSCDFLFRRLDDMYMLYWEEQGFNYVKREFTAGIRDGEGAPGWQQSLTNNGASGLLRDGRSQDPICFVMDMIHEEEYRRGHHISYTWWGFALLVLYDPSTGDVLSTIRLPSYGQAEPTAKYYGLAYDDGDGTFWYSRPIQASICCPVPPPSTGLYHVDSGGNEIDTFNLEGYFIVGLALDTDNDHLWCIARGEPDVLLEYDVSTGAPELIQGPFDMPWIGAGDRAAAGLDYDEGHHRLVAVNAVAGTKECFDDVDPGFSGFRETQDPGVIPAFACYLTETPSPWGLALNAAESQAFVAGSPQGGPFPLDVYGLCEGGSGGTSQHAVISTPREDPTGPSISGLVMRIHPNPFNPSTGIHFTLPTASRVELDVFDVTGRRVRSLIAGEEWGAGEHRVTWDGTDGRGVPVSAGVYFGRLQVGAQVVTRQMVVLQ